MGKMIFYKVLRKADCLFHGFLAGGRGEDREIRKGKKSRK